MTKRNINLIASFFFLCLNVSMCIKYINLFITGEETTLAIAIYYGFFSLWFLVTGVAIYALDTFQMRKNEK